MALTKYKQFRHVISQEGSYVILNDNSTWPIMGFAQTDTVQCMVWQTIQSAVPVGTRSYSFRDDNNAFLGNTHEEYSIWVYGVPKWDAGANNIVDDVVWDSEKVWVAIKVNTGSQPSSTNSDWQEVDDTNLDKLNGLPEDLSTSYGFIPAYSPSQGNIDTKKTGDHKFEVTWIGSGNLTSYKIRNYKDDELASETATTNKVTYTFDKDGVYIVELLTSDGTTHFAEVYDFTDTEICYLELMKNTLCECLDCNDCPGKGYERALNYANSYMLLRDMIYADQSTRIGLTSTEILRKEYVNMIGMLVDKLIILADECSCSEDTKL